MSSIQTYVTPSTQEVVAPSSGPCWEIAYLFPERGDWTEADFLALPTNRLVELSDGTIKVLPMADWAHQLIVRFLFKLLDSFVVDRRAGEVMFAPLPVRLWPSKMREPDIVFVQNDRPRPRKYSDGADLVVEVVSEGEENRIRDLVEKRAEYAKAGISEYWIVDPELQQITVLALEGETYREHGVFRPGKIASSKLLDGFTVAVADVFAAANL